MLCSPIRIKGPVPFAHHPTKCFACALSKMVSFDTNDLLNGLLPLRPVFLHYPNFLNSYEFVHWWCPKQRESYKRKWFTVCLAACGPYFLFKSILQQYMVLRCIEFGSRTDFSPLTCFPLMVQVHFSHRSLKFHTFPEDGGT